MEKILKAPALFVGAAAIEKAIGSIKSRGAKLDGDIQLAGLSILAHVQEHGDTTLADRLFNAMPKGSRRQMLAEWFVAYGKMRALAGKPDAERIKQGHVFGYDKERKTDMQAAEAKPWFEMKKQQEASTAFDAQAAVLNLFKRLKAAQENGLTIEHQAEALAEAQALVTLLTPTV